MKYIAICFALFSSLFLTPLHADTSSDLERAWIESESKIAVEYLQDMGFSVVCVYNSEPQLETLYLNEILKGITKLVKISLSAPTVSNSPKLCVTVTKVD